MTTQDNKYELRIKFLLRSTDGTTQTTRTISVPCYPLDSERQAAILTALKGFHDTMVQGSYNPSSPGGMWLTDFEMPLFMQVAAYKDYDGSTIEPPTSGDGAYVTYGLEASFVETNTTAWDNDELKTNT